MAMIFTAYKIRVIVHIIDYEKLQINYHAVNGLSALNVVKVQMYYEKIEC